MRVALILAVIFLIACGQQETRPVESTTDQLSSDDGPAQQLLASYEHVRSQLANDEASSKEDFESIAAAARAAAVVYSGEAKGHLEQLATSAESAATKATQGLDHAREAFGEVSQHLIALLSADPDLAKGRYVFECPMAESYPKWVQQSETVSNPYMGPEMATCGVASKWQP